MNNNGGEEKKVNTETSKILYGNTLYEQVHNPDKKMSYFLGWDAKKEETKVMDYIEDDNIIYWPIQDELLEKKAVLLPSEAIEYQSIQELEIEIDSFIQVWLDISDDHRQKAVWYIMLSWIIDKLNTIPYLRALGDYGTGKTRYLDVIGGLCYKPMFVGGAVRSAPIYRVIEKWRGTSIFDEFTLGKSDETEDIVQILNNGYQRGKPVLRCANANYDKVNVFDPFGAKILSTRKYFKDRALESRCLTEIMKSTGRNDIPIDLTSQFYKSRTELQNKLLMYRFKNWNEINPDESINVDFGDILPRIKQSLSPFIVLFQHDQKKLTRFIGYAQQHNQKIVEDNSSSFDGQIINHYLKLLEEHEEEQQHFDDYKECIITSSKIRDSMVNNGWNSDKLTSATIGRRLKPLGFESTPKKINGKTTKVVDIDNERLKILRMRYVPEINDN